VEDGEERQMQRPVNHIGGGHTLVEVMVGIQWERRLRLWVNELARLRSEKVLTVRISAVRFQLAAIASVSALYCYRAC
jgi:hypothetical protein